MAARIGVVELGRTRLEPRLLHQSRHTLASHPYARLAQRPHNARRTVGTIASGIHGLDTGQ